MTDLNAELLWLFMGGISQLEQQHGVIKSYAQLRKNAEPLKDQGSAGNPQGPALLVTRSGALPVENT